MILGFVGFDPSPVAGPQMEEALTGMRIAYSVIPIVGTLLGMAVMWKYDLNKTRACEIREELEKRRESES